MTNPPETEPPEAPPPQTPSAAPPWVPDPSPDKVGRTFARLGLVALGFVLVWFMDLRWEAARQRFAATFEWPMGIWVTFLGLGVLAGLAFGIGFFLPARFGRYRWARVLALGIPPVLLIVLGLVFLADPELLFGAPAFIGDTLSRLLDLLGGTFQALASILLGVALVSGFAEPRPRQPRYVATPFSSPPPPVA